MIDIAYAMGTGGEAAGGGSGFGALFPLIAMFAIFYFLLIRPQQKKQKEHRQMLGELKKLRRLNVAGNELKTLPRSLLDLPDLKKLEIRGNDLPKKVLESGKSSPRAILSSLHKGGA